VLCGSRKYQAKDPFNEFAKGYINTYLNALTYADKTMYPIASRNKKDFMKKPKKTGYMSYNLIVSGKCRGEVWDFTDVGVQPCCERQDFFGWFELWLDEGEDADYFKDYVYE